MLSSIAKWKIWAVAGAAFMALIGMLKYQKAKRQVAEHRADIAEENQELLQEERAALEKIDRDRKVWDEEQSKDSLDNIVALESLKNETNDTVVVNTLLGMYDKDRNKTKTDGNTR